MTKINKIGVLSAGKVYGALLSILGLIAGVFYAVVFLTVGTVSKETSDLGFGIGAGLGIFSIIFFPLLYGIVGFISGVIMGFLYNLAARIVGGVEVEIEGNQAK